MANDKLPPWFMQQAMHGTCLMAIIKKEGGGRQEADHMPVVVPNTMRKIVDKVMMGEC
jgi:hypothetical protein